ncbi:MAG: methyltransferase family protein [Terriglobia bacterium]
MTKKQWAGVLTQTGLGFGLLFLGWGFDDLPGFFAHPARAGLVVVALLGLVALVFVPLDIAVFRRGKKPIGTQRYLLAAVMVVALAMVFFLGYGDRRGLLTFDFAGTDALRWLGLAFYAGGNVLAFAALRALGKQYSGYVTVQDDHKLVQRGIYGVIRHPIYLRALLVGLGFPLLFRSWLVLVFFGFAVTFVAHRIRQEERLLAEEFGAAFEAYRQRTWRLLPYLY